MFRLTAAEKREVVTNCDHLKSLKFSPQNPASLPTTARNFSSPFEPVKLLQLQTTENPFMPPQKNTLYYGDNLDILRRYIPDQSIDLYPPLNNYEKSMRRWAKRLASRMTPARKRYIPPLRTVTLRDSKRTQQCPTALWLREAGLTPAPRLNYWQLPTECLGSSTVYAQCPSI